MALLLYRDHRHAGFTQSFITEKKRQEFRLVSCEVWFNYFGIRGVVDVVLRKDFPADRSCLWLVCEIKSQLWDIGEAIRQVRRTEQYFCCSRPDLKVEGWNNSFQFPLVLEANENNFKQWMQHHDLFKDLEIVFHHENPSQVRQVQNWIEIQQAIIVGQQMDSS